MRFVVRVGADPFGRADPTMLLAMGLPGSGIVRVGNTHVFVRPGQVSEGTALYLGELTLANAGIAAGTNVEVRRTQLPLAQRVVLAPEAAVLDTRHLTRALQGLPVTVGDVVNVDPAYGTARQAALIRVRVDLVEPAPAAMVGGGTLVTASGASTLPTTEQTSTAPAQPGAAPPTTADALLAGLDRELELLSGWISLLTSSADLPTAWGLPRVAGILLNGPPGCGKSELVAAAAKLAGVGVREIGLDLVFKPEKLLELAEQAVRDTAPPAVIFLDRLDAVAGNEGMFRPQMAAILRWFLDAVAGRSRLACVLGTASGDGLAGVAGSPLIPRTLTIPPPNLERRRLLFQAALAKVPNLELDFDLLAARSAGFSAADVVASVVHASALVARSGAPVTAEVMVSAIEETRPSLGSISLGEMPSRGFEGVANLENIKQRLTEAVIWPLTDPARFIRMGIVPPRGILLSGPPGTGKTFVVRALAHEAGAAFFPIKGAELLDKYVGESERAVRELFARARAAAPSILFFDEIDAIAPVRGRSTTSVTDSVVAALLTELDGIASRGEVVVIGATNRVDLIDPAIIRGGRLELHLELGLPEAAARLAMLKLSRVPMARDVDPSWLVENTDGYSFSDLEVLLREAALHGLRRDPKAIEVTKEDFEAALIAKLKAS